MMQSPLLSSALLLLGINACLFLSFPTQVRSHGYLKTPRSRNYVAYADGKYSPLLAENPQIEDCPHCLNLGGTLAQCGITGDTNYDSPKNALGGDMHTNIQARFTEGETITVDVVLTAHHKGHFTFSACPIDPNSPDAPSQACFEQYPLEYVDDLLYSAPKDPNYPYRAYIAPAGWPDAVTDGSGVSGMLFSFRFKLPDDLKGDFVLLQWHYLTANSCAHEGYERYAWPDPSWNPTNMDACGVIPPDGRGVPEQFWNCAEISVAPSSPTPPTIAPPPSSPPTVATAQPVTTPTNSPPVSGEYDDSRLIAYLGNWQACPTADQIAQYTHIVIAFAVSYTWDPTKNVCSETCEIAEPTICNNSPNPALISEWQAAGKKVILSFGGAGMGGSWAGDNNDCWEYCFGRETQVVNRLTEIVNNMGLDGIDIDYEYFYEDRPDAIHFLRKVTEGMRANLDPGAIVTHAPMEPDIDQSTSYFDLLVDIADLLDFVMPQYYNGFTRPALDGFDGGAVSAEAHYTAVVNILFDGDATKVIFGFCITGCLGSATGEQAAAVMSQVNSYYECNGGAYFWVANDDVGGAWSRPVSAIVAPNAGCSGPPTTPAPYTARPTNEPTAPVPAPTKFPTATPFAAPTEPPHVAPIAAPTSEGKCCPVGFTGLRAYDSCQKYIHCNNGVVYGADAIACSPGTLFDNNLQYCNHQAQVQCAPESCNSIAPTPTPPDNEEMCCFPGQTGLRPYDSCNKYYHCVSGTVTGSEISCPVGTLFNANLNICDWAASVTCNYEICPSTTE